MYLGEPFANENKRENSVYFPSEFKILILPELCKIRIRHVEITEHRAQSQHLVDEFLSLQTQAVGMFSEANRLDSRQTDFQTNIPWIYDSDEVDDLSFQMNHSRSWEF